MRFLVSILLLFTVGCSTRSNEEVTNESIPNTNDFREIVCFVYHRFNDNRFPSTNISSIEFEKHLAALKKEGFVVLQLSQAVNALKSGTDNKRIAVITIDDGYKSFYTHALPLLRKYNFPATLFVNTETIGASDYMDWNQLKDCSANKIEIGNHTHSHPYFLNQPDSSRRKDFMEEVRKSQRLIEEKLQLTPTVFAYPYGEFDESMKTDLKSMGFIGAAAQNSGVLNSLTDVYEIPRFPMSENYAGEFAAKCKMRPLLIDQIQSPGHITGGDRTPPALSISFRSTDLRLEELQCFVQGGGCKMDWLTRTDSVTKISVQATNDISSRRRTLYTITVPDSANVWHWFSYLWVNPKTK